HPLVTVHRQEVLDLASDEPTIVATGPLTSEAMSAYLKGLAGEEYLFFFDAAAPILTLESLDMTKVFRAGRKGLARKHEASVEGEGDYLNCPFTKEEYLAFWEALTAGE